MIMIFILGVAHVDHVFEQVGPKNNNIWGFAFN